MDTPQRGAYPSLPTICDFTFYFVCSSTCTSAFPQLTSLLCVDCSQVEDKTDLDYAAGGDEEDNDKPKDDKQGKEEKKSKPENKKKEGGAEEEKMEVAFVLLRIQMNDIS